MLRGCQKTGPMSKSQEKCIGQMPSASIKARLQLGRGTFLRCTLSSAHFKCIGALGAGNMKGGGFGFFENRPKMTQKWPFASATGSYVTSEAFFLNACGAVVLYTRFQRSKQALAKTYAFATKTPFWAPKWAKNRAFCHISPHRRVSPPPFPKFYDPHMFPHNIMWFELDRSLSAKTRASERPKFGTFSEADRPCPHDTRTNRCTGSPSNSNCICVAKENEPKAGLFAPQGNRSE